MAWAIKVMAKAKPDKSLIGVYYNDLDSNSK